jgi:site-specific recombinase XerD
MESQEQFTTDNLLQRSDLSDQSLHEPDGNRASPTNVTRSRSIWTTGVKLARDPIAEAHLTLVASDVSYPDQATHEGISSMRLAEFVQRRFIPEYVEVRRSAGRAHFRAILKHVLSPDQVVRAFDLASEGTNARRKAIHDWPYIGSLRLCEINEGVIQHLTSTALEQGYSIQTVTHIRNVIRAIFSHAIRGRCYSGENPAALVTLPVMARKTAHTLTLAQLKQIMPAMHYPEKGIALFALLTDMSVAEICGLQWQNVNLSSNGIALQDDWIPPKAIAIRNQWYRGELALVMGSRSRFIAVPELLCSILRDLRSRKQFPRPHDFVLASRSGTPVYPENIAARRLKSIGKEFGMPWLSWCVFHRTHFALRSEFGRQLHKEYEKVLPLQMW